jgi:hypothetical protein
LKSIESQIENLRYKEEPYVGMPIPNPRCYCEPDSVCDSVNTCPLAMAYVPMQRWCQTYAPQEGFHRGTIFPELDLSFYGDRGGAC